MTNAFSILVQCCLPRRGRGTVALSLHLGGTVHGGMGQCEARMLGSHRAAEFTLHAVLDGDDVAGASLGVGHPKDVVAPHIGLKGTNRNPFVRKDCFDKFECTMQVLLGSTVSTMEDCVVDGRGFGTSTVTSNTPASPVVASLEQQMQQMEDLGRTQKHNVGSETGFGTGGSMKRGQTRHKTIEPLSPNGSQPSLPDSSETCSGKHKDAVPH